MADRVKLLTELTGPNASTYAAAVAGGSNTALLALLNAPHATAKKGQTVASTAMLAAVAPAMKLLSATQLQRLQVVLAGGTVDFSDPDTVNEVKDIFGGQAAVLTRLAALATVPKTVAEVTCDSPVTLDDLWAVLPLIPTSHHARNLAGQV